VQSTFPTTLPRIQPLQEPKSIWSDLTHEIKPSLGDKFVSGYKIQASRSARRGAKQQLSGCAKEWCAVMKVQPEDSSFPVGLEEGRSYFPDVPRNGGPSWNRGSPRRPRLLEEVQSNIPAGPEEVGCNCRQHLATERGVARCGVVEVHDCCKRCKGTLRLGCAVQSSAKSDHLHFDAQMERRANSNQIDFGTPIGTRTICILAHKSKGVSIPTQIGFDICILARKLKPVLNN
jgi:hypothetical protein